MNASELTLTETFIAEFLEGGNSAGVPLESVTHPTLARDQLLSLLMQYQRLPVAKRQFRIEMIREDGPGTPKTFRAFRILPAPRR